MKKLEEKFEIMVEVDLVSIEGGFIIIIFIVIVWGVLGVVIYMYGCYLGSRC